MTRHAGRMTDSEITRCWIQELYENLLDSQDIDEGLGDTLDIIRTVDPGLAACIGKMCLAKKNLRLYIESRMELTSTHNES